MDSLPIDSPPDVPRPLRVLFVSGMTAAFFAADGDTARAVVEGVREAFSGLSERFGIRVLGTLDDDRIMVGESTSWPWTGYILADVPDLGAVIAVCNQLREVRVGKHRLWKYMRLEARIGRPRFFEAD